MPRTIDFLRGQRRVGVFRAREVSMPDWREAMMPVADMRVWNELGRPPLWTVASAEWFDAGLRSQGLGLRMYRVLASYVFARGGVWHKLYQDYECVGSFLVPPDA